MEQAVAAGGESWSDIRGRLLSRPDDVVKMLEPSLSFFSVLTGVNIGELKRCRWVFMLAAFACVLCVLCFCCGR